VNVRSEEASAKISNFLAKMLGSLLNRLRCG